MSKILNFEVVSISAIPQAGDKHFITVIPATDVDDVLTKNRIGFSYAQLQSIAVNNGLESAEVLFRALNRGGSKLSISGDFCKEGAEYTDNDGNVGTYTKDWWRFDMLSVIFQFGDVATRFIDAVDTNVLTNLAMQEANARKDAAALIRRNKLIALMGHKEEAPTALEAPGIELPEGTTAKTEAKAEVKTDAKVTK
jgi:hypothetical protein